VIVTLAEELPARETVALARTVRESLRIPLGPLIVNALPPEAAGRTEVRTVLARTRDAVLDPALQSTLSGASIMAARRSDAERIIENLRRNPGLPLIQLPRMPTNDIGPTEVEQLSRLLDLGNAFGSAQTAPQAD
jgi:hypothetical protein